MTHIKTKQAYYQAMAEIESLLAKGLDNLTATEDARLDELTTIVEAWENTAYPMPMQPDFKAILLYLMQSQGYNQTELSNELHVSKSLLSEVLRGNKSPNLEMLKNVFKRFAVDGNTLLNSI